MRVDVSEQLSASRIGRYRIVDRLAIGGMAEVFLATEEDEPLVAPGGPARAARADGPRLVVLKRLLPHLAQQDEFVRAFAHEARVAMRIDHPNVVRIHELGESGGLPFIAMEYLHGSSVRELLAALAAVDELLSIEVAVDLLCQACAGAHAAHELTDDDGRPCGLVHRDITPHNLMVGDSGHLKLLDFGIAKAADGVDHTRTGILKGKIAYMSPEQCRQEPVDRRSDVFSLGVVGYQLLTGAKPFRGPSELATMQAIIAGRWTPLAELRRDVPPALARAIERALSPRPGDRFADAEALRTAVDLAARTTGYAPEQRRTGTLIRRMLGPAHDARQEAIARALGQAAPGWSDPRPQTESLSLDATGGTRSGLRPAPPHRDSSRWAAAGFAVAAILVVATLAAVATLVLPAGRGAGATAAPVVFDDPQPVTVVVAPTMAPDELRADLEPLRGFLEREIRRPVALVVAPSYREAAEAVISGEAPYAILPPATAERAAIEAPSLTVVAVKRVDGSSSSDGFLLVRRDDPIRSVAELAGRTVCWTDAWSLTGYIMPREYLAEHGVDVEHDLVDRFSGNHEQALLDLLDGRCDAAATFSGNYETADQRGIATARLRILAITGRSPHDAVVAAATADPAVTARLQAALLAFDPLRDGLRIGDGERITGFDLPEAPHPPPVP